MEDHSGYLTERAITGLEARAIKGAVVMIEREAVLNAVLGQTRAYFHDQTDILETLRRLKSKILRLFSIYHWRTLSLISCTLLAL